MTKNGRKRKKQGAKQREKALFTHVKVIQSWCKNMVKEQFYCCAKIVQSARAHVQLNAVIKRD